jgi:hypothetical protein
LEKSLSPVVVVLTVAVAVLPGGLEPLIVDISEIAIWKEMPEHKVAEAAKERKKRKKKESLGSLGEIAIIFQHRLVLPSVPNNLHPLAQ